MDERKCLPSSVAKATCPMVSNVAAVAQGLHSFRFQLNLSSSVHRLTQPNALMCPGVAQVELQHERV